MRLPCLLGLLVVVTLGTGERVILAEASAPAAAFEPVAPPPSSGAVAVATGDLFTCVVTATGAVQCWGSNRFGQLGDGTFIDHGTPAGVNGLASGAASIAAGSTHICVLTTGGGVKCWGGNVYGQLGDGTTTPRVAPTDVTGLTSGVVAIAAAQYHTCALTTGGGLKCWGGNSNGQLGDGSTTDRSTPVNVTGLTSGVIAVAAGNDATHTCAVTSGGVKCWGNNGNGQLGDGSTTQRTTPVNVSGLASGVVALSTGSAFTCALTSSGAAKCWGDNGNGQLGDGTNSQRLTPTPVSGLASGVTALASGLLHSCALMTSGAVQCWGFGVYGQLGDGTVTTRSTPAAVPGLAHAVYAIAAGYDHTCAVTTDGGVQCWGSNQYGQLGTGRLFIRVAVGDVVGLTSGVASLAIGADHGCVVRAGGGVQCWGQNYYGQLGNGTLISLSTPASVSGLTSGVAAVAAGGFHSCALTTGGGLQCWGLNSEGELGDGSFTTRSVPADVVGLTSGVAAVMTGDLHSCALTSAGGVKCWGFNGNGRLGDGTTINRATPVDVSGLTSGVVALAVGPTADHMCAVTSAGGMKCWGSNNKGQLGDGTTTDRSTPVNVTGLSSGVTAASIGGAHTCALTSGGIVKCWGNNDVGQLGDGTTTQRLTPVPINGMTGVSGVTAGSTHTCARTSSNGAKCWGGNYGGQLGDGTLTDRPAPVDVAGLGSGLAAVAAGYAHTCALTSSAGVKCWGNNKAGELGDGDILQRSTPANVSGYGATVTLTNLNQLYDGSPKAVTVTTTPAGLVVTVTYTGTNGTSYGPTTAAPSSVGTYKAFATINDPNYSGSGSATATLTITTGATATPTSLHFGATKAGAGGAINYVTPAQKITITFNGPSSGWTATGDQSWLQITNGSAAGAGSFTAAIVNPGNVIGGSTSLTATVTVTAPNAANSPLTIPVTLTVDQTGSSTQPAFGQVDTPTQSASGIVGAIGVTGWVIDDIGVQSVKLYRNCLGFDNPASCQVIAGNNVVFIGDAAFVPGARPDVESAFANYPAGNVAGWGYLLLTNMLPNVTGSQGYGGQGTITLYTLATDIEGHVSLIGRSQSDHTPTTFTMANTGIAKPFGAIDTPSQGGTVSGTFPNFGWVLTPDLNTVADGTDILMPINGSTITLYIDGVAVGTVTYNQCRGNVGNPVSPGVYCNDDVSSIFGNTTPQPTFTTRTSNPTKYRNLDAGRSAIGSFDVNTSGLSNGMHSIAWGVSDSNGRGEGIGSRNFFVLNGGGSGAMLFGEPVAGLNAMGGTSEDELRAQMLKALQSRGDIDSLPTTFASVRVSGRTGFSPRMPFDVINAEPDGLRRVQIPDLGRVELHLGGYARAGYLVAGQTLRDLPVGSHLDATTGTFTWAPAPGYFGTYHLVFIVNGDQLQIDVTIRPMKAPDGATRR